MRNPGIKTFFTRHLLIVMLAAGVLCGALSAFAVSDPPTQKKLFSGYLSVFEVSFDLLFSKALFMQFLPILVMYLFAYGSLILQASSLVLFFRGAIGGAGIVLLWRTCPKSGAFYLLFAFLLLTEITAMLVCHSCGKLSLLFYAAYSAKKTRFARRKFSGDVLFFAGVIFLIYLMRACALCLIRGG